MTIQGPDHPTDYRMVKLTDGTLLVGTISTTETELTIENPLQLTTVQRLTEVGMKDDSSLAPWIPFTSDKKFNISKDKVVVISLAAKELAHYYEVILNKLQNTKIRPPLSTEEMQHILKVAEEMDKEREEKLLEYEEDIFGKKTVH
tara:strand:+ start:240 stop:677 length:438 start_codon:yes stop_codon:yes gene_type:complete